MRLGRIRLACSTTGGHGLHRMQHAYNLVFTESTASTVFEQVITRGNTFRGKRFRHVKRANIYRAIGQMENALALIRSNLARLTASDRVKVFAFFRTNDGYTGFHGITFLVKRQLQ